jgi:hypothetical protein
MEIDHECNYVSYMRYCFGVYEYKVATLRAFDVTSNKFKVHAARSLWQQVLGQNSNNNINNNNNNNRCVGQETYCS